MLLGHPVDSFIKYDRLIWSVFNNKEENLLLLSPHPRVNKKLPVSEREPGRSKEVLLVFHFSWSVFVTIFLMLNSGPNGEEYAWYQCTVSLHCFLCKRTHLHWWWSSSAIVFWECYVLHVILHCNYRFLLSCFHF